MVQKHYSQEVKEAIVRKMLPPNSVTVKHSSPVPFFLTEFEDGFRADLIVEDKIIVELKSVEKVMPVHKKQLLTYLRLSDRKLGLLVNFGDNLIKNGITRVINGNL